eukprot:SAG11_NODE_3769_length_2237_cov_1.175865_3_plen_143_part_00
MHIKSRTGTKTQHSESAALLHSVFGQDNCSPEFVARLPQLADCIGLIDGPATGQPVYLPLGGWRKNHQDLAEEALQVQSVAQLPAALHRSHPLGLGQIALPRMQSLGSLDAPAFVRLCQTRCVTHGTSPAIFGTSSEFHRCM